MSHNKKIFIISGRSGGSVSAVSKSKSAIVNVIILGTQTLVVTMKLKLWSLQSPKFAILGIISRCSNRSKVCDPQNIYELHVDDLSNGNMEAGVNQANRNYDKDLINLI